MLYIDKDTDKAYTKTQLEIMWNELPNEVKQDYKDEDIHTFDDWLESATDFSGNLLVLA